MASIYLPPIARKKKVDGYPRYVLTPDASFLIFNLSLIMMKSSWIRKINRLVCGHVISHSSSINGDFRCKPCVPVGGRRKRRQNA